MSNDYNSLSDLGTPEDIRLIVTKAREYWNAEDDCIFNNTEDEKRVEEAKEALLDAIEFCRINPRYREGLE